jgi:ribosomal protein S18 acetylase RimI-like enzyme
MSVPVLLRPVGPADLEFLARLYAATRVEELSTTGWPQSEIEAFLRMQWQAQQTDYTRRFPAADHEIVLVDGEPAGRIWVDRGDEEIRLLDLSVMPAHRNRGIGTQLLVSLQNESTRVERVLCHSVVKGNLGALRLYHRLGFTVVGGVDTHHFMEWSPERS